MKADHIIKNAKIFTSDKDNPQATALAVKDGKFVYVGDEAGLAAYEGAVTDLGASSSCPASSIATSMSPCRSDSSMRIWGCVSSVTANRKRWT